MTLREYAARVEERLEQLARRGRGGERRHAL